MDFMLYIISMTQFRNNFSILQCVGVLIETTGGIFSMSIPQGGCVQRFTDRLSEEMKLGQVTINRGDANGSQISLYYLVHVSCQLFYS